MSARKQWFGRIMGALGLAGGLALALGSRVTPMVATAGQPETGTIRGMVAIDVGQIPDPVFVDVTADQSACGDQVEDRTTVVDENGGVANAVISVTGLPWSEDPPPAIINNAQCYFQPRVQVAKTGSIVSIQSEDTALHTTHAYDDRARTMFNIAIPIPGMQIERPLRRPGVVRVECDSHGWMRGWVFVTDDVATVTEAGGTFELTGIPAGTYELTVWHERYEGASHPVTVTAGETTETDFRLE